MITLVKTEPEPRCLKVRPDPQALKDTEVLPHCAPLLDWSPANISCPVLLILAEWVGILWL